MLNTGMVDIQHDVMQTCVNFLGFPAQARSVLRHFQARCCYTASISRFTRCKQYACLLEQFSRFDGGRHICSFGDGFNAIGDKLMRGVNIQFVLYNDQIYVIEVNPRSSRTVPYISKVTGVPMVDLATRCMFGEKLKDMGCGTGLHPESDHYAVKVPVFSFQKLRDLDTQLGPEMKSTGEVLGVAKTFREALLKGLTGAGFQMKKKGAVLISVRDSDKQEAIRIGERFEALGFDIYATSGTANVLNRHMVATNSIRNVDEPSPNIIDLIESGKIDYVVATSVKGRHPELGSVHIRRTAVERAIPCLTSMDTVSALLRCLEGDVKIENCEMVDINTI